jgi:hypothetical protein
MTEEEDKEKEEKEESGSCWHDGYLVESTEGKRCPRCGKLIYPALSVTSVSQVRVVTAP